jgi:hypothetical protein
MNEKSTLTNKVRNVFNKSKNIGSKVINSTTKIKNNISTGISDKVNKISNITNKPQWFQSSMNMYNSFIESNTAFSKFVFIILLLLAFIFLLQVSMIIMTKFINGYSGEVYVINGLVNANREKIVYNNPNENESVSIIRSVNENDGIEFTWSVWVYVDSLGTDTYKYYKIFSKGKGVLDASLNTNILGTTSQHLPYSKIINNSPGMYLTKYIPSNENKSYTAPSIKDFTVSSDGKISLAVVLITYNVDSTDNDFAEIINIDEVPVKKWFNCTLVVKNKTANIYFNGKLYTSKDLNNVPLQNNYDVYVGETSGFDGYISNLRYFNRAILYEEIQNINSYGPNMKSVDTINATKNDYLAMSWYYNTL